MIKPGKIILTYLHLFFDLSAPDRLNIYNYSRNLQKRITAFPHTNEQNLP